MRSARRFGHVNKVIHSLILVIQSNPLYEHPRNEDSSLLPTVCPWERKALTFSLNSTRININNINIINTDAVYGPLSVRIYERNLTVPEFSLYSAFIHSTLFLVQLHFYFPPPL